MIRRNTLIVVVVFAVMLAATLFWQRTKSRDDSLADSTPVEVDPAVIDLGSASVVGITLQDADRKTIKLELDDAGEWRLVIPNAPADSGAVGSTLSGLLSMTASSSLSSSTALVDLGLSPPDKRIVLDLDDGGQFVLNVGNETPIGNGYYVLSNASDRKIYVANKFSLDSLLNWLETPPVAPPTPTPTVEIDSTQDSSVETPAP